MERCKLCDGRLSSRKRAHICDTNINKKKIKKEISNPSDKTSDISSSSMPRKFIKKTSVSIPGCSITGKSIDLKDKYDHSMSETTVERGKDISSSSMPKKFIKKTSVSIPGCSITGKSIDLKDKYDHSMSETKIERGKVREKVQLCNIDLQSICLGCLRKSPELSTHPIVKGGICSSCSDNWLLGTSLNEENPGHCLICGKKRDSLKCSNAKCELNSVFCKICINEYYPPRNLLSIRDWLCIVCNPSGSDILVKQNDWEKNMCYFKFGKNMNKRDHMMNKLVVKQSRNPIRVLSLFDGIGSGFVSLKKLGLVIKDYFASEIDEDAIKVATIRSGGKITQIGDITILDTETILKMGKFDLVIGGSPCTDFSLVNPARRGLYDLKSSGMLFFDYVRILEILKNKNPDILFLFENTAAMEKIVKKDISRFLGVQPILLDSKLFCPMRRARYFWGNIPLMDDFSNLPNEQKSLASFLSEKCGRIPLVNCVRTLTTNSNSMGQGTYRHLPVMMLGKEDSLWITEVEKLFGFDEHYTDVGNISLNKRFTLMGNSWCIPVISYLLRGLTSSFPLVS